MRAHSDRPLHCCRIGDPQPIGLAGLGHAGGVWPPQQHTQHSRGHDAPSALVADGLSRRPVDDGTSDAAAMLWWKIDLDCFGVGPANPRRRSWQ